MLMLSRYRRSGSSGGCHCHGPDNKWDSAFDLVAVESLWWACERAADFVMLYDPYSVGSDTDDYQFALFRPATEEEMNLIDVKDPIDFNRPGEIIGEVAKFPIYTSEYELVVRDRRAQVDAKKVEQERIRQEKLAQAKEADERKLLGQLKAKYGG